MAEEVTNGREQLLKPRLGYDIVALNYEQWHWFEFWRQNEAPIVGEWLESLKPGLGLDAGSGTGPYIRDIVELGHRCVAVDLSWQMLKINKEKKGDRTRTSAVLYIQGDINALSLRDSQFDWVLCTRVLSHVSDLRRVLKEFARVLKRGGECLISDIHPDHPYNSVAIPTDRGKIAIETYKHPIADFKRAVSDVKDFQLLSLDEYYFNDLRWKPPRTNFDKLYRYTNPAIFYVSRLKRL